MVHIKIFPKLDKIFLKQTEQLIKSSETFRESRDWSTYLSKLQTHGINYFVIGTKNISYFEERPADIRPVQIIDVNQEIKELSQKTDIDERIVKSSLMGYGLIAPGNGCC
jgi:hypothetical protein